MKQEFSNIAIDIRHQINFKIPNINRGGCGIFAKYFAKECVKHKIEHQIILLTTTSAQSVEDFINYYYDELPNKKARSIDYDVYYPSLCHLMVKVDDKFYDSSGQYNQNTLKMSRWDGYAHYNLPLDVLEWICRLQRLWNNAYSRYYNREIQSKLKKIFNKNLVIKK